MSRSFATSAPSAPGAKDWHPSSFSPKTGLLYVPHNNLCMDFEGVEVSYIAGTPYVGANVVYKPGPGGQPRESSPAWDPAAGKAVWKIKEKYPAWSGTVATAGDLVFYGTMEGWFKAVNARTGQVCGSSSADRASSASRSRTAARMAISTWRYSSGIGGWPGAVVANDLDTRDPDRRGRLGQGDGGPARWTPTVAARSTCSRWKANEVAPVAGHGRSFSLRRRACLAAWRLPARCAHALRVCADPNNLPFSNERGEGFENQLAEMVARDLGTRVSTIPGGRSAADSSATR